MIVRSVQICGALAGMLLALIAVEVRSRSVAGDAIAMPVYRDFLRLLSADVWVRVVCPDRASFDEFSQRIGSIRCKLQPVIVDHEMTVWSRDRWVALSPTESSSRTTLLTPANEDASIVWPQRAGDARYSRALLIAVSPY